MCQSQYGDKSNERGHETIPHEETPFLSRVTKTSGPRFLTSPAQPMASRGFFSPSELHLRCGLVLSEAFSCRRPPTPGRPCRCHRAFYRRRQTRIEYKSRNAGHSWRERSSPGVDPRAGMSSSSSHWREHFPDLLFRRPSSPLRPYHSSEGNKT